MAERECRIILRGGRMDLKTELSLYDPSDGREARWNFLVGPRQEDIDREVLKLKATLERQGNRVSVVKFKG